MSKYFNAVFIPYAWCYMDLPKKFKDNCTVSIKLG